MNVRRKGISLSIPGSVPVLDTIEKIEALSATLQLNNNGENDRAVRTLLLLLLLLLHQREPTTTRTDKGVGDLEILLLRTTTALPFLLSAARAILSL